MRRMPARNCGSAMSLTVLSGAKPCHDGPALYFTGDHGNPHIGLGDVPLRKTHFFLPSLQKPDDIIRLTYVRSISRVPSKKRKDPERKITVQGQ